MLQNAERQWSAHPVLAVGWQAAVSQLRCLCLGSCLSLRPCRMLLPWMVDAFLRPKACWCRRSVRRAPPCRPTRLCIFGGFWSDALHHIAMSLPPLRKCCRSSSASVLLLTCLCWLKKHRAQGTNPVTNGPQPPDPVNSQLPRGDRPRHQRSTASGGPAPSPTVRSLGGTVLRNNGQPP